MLEAISPVQGRPLRVAGSKLLRIIGKHGGPNGTALWEIGTTMQAADINSVSLRPFTRGQTSSTTEPVVSRFSISLCAFAASASAYL